MLFVGVVARLFLFGGLKCAFRVEAWASGGGPGIHAPNQSAESGLMKSRSPTENPTTKQALQRLDGGTLCFGTSRCVVGCAERLCELSPGTAKPHPLTPKRKSKGTCMRKTRSVAQSFISAATHA